MILELHFQGRNDDYEPDWLNRISAAIAYNRRLFDDVGIDLHVVFTEWNPPPDRPWIGPQLAARFPFFRAVVVPADVHSAVSGGSTLDIIPTLAANVALRSSSADFWLITGGDIFIGREVARRIAQGLRRGVLYRAERVNIDDRIDFASATPTLIEHPSQVRSIDSCSIPPYDVAPYTNASGDFILLDRGSFFGLRGCDERIRQARLHVDFRCVMQAHLANLPSVLLGQVFHINHSKSLINIGNQPYRGVEYDYRADLPYFNEDDWGLWSWSWEEASARVAVVTPVRADDSEMVTRPFTPVETEYEAQVRETLREARWRRALSRPQEGTPTAAEELVVAQLVAQEFWAPAAVSHDANSAVVSTGDVPWSYSAQLLLAPTPDSSNHYAWLAIHGSTLSGCVGVSILDATGMLHVEVLAAAPEQPVDAPGMPPLTFGSATGPILLPLPPGFDLSGASLLVRNGPAAVVSRIRIDRVQRLTQRIADVLLTSAPGQ